MNQIVKRFAFNYQVSLTTFSKDHCRPRIAVIIRSHRISIGSRIQHCQNIAWLGFWQWLMLTENIA